MKLEGPDRFSITIHRNFEGGSFEIGNAEGLPRFTGLATKPGPKLYVVSVAEVPIYVGITRQRMSTRLRFGWTADGKRGYHGYRWRHDFDHAHLDLWYQAEIRKGEEEGKTAAASLLDIETVEAEVAYLIRQMGNWPAYQTEIHFHQSSDQHRYAARRIFEHYVRR